MKDFKTKERFVELRAAGKSYSYIAQELKVSKPTLIDWSKELRHQISNLRAIEWETLSRKYFIAKEKRLIFFSRLIEKLLVEIEKRDLSQVDTVKLFEILLKYSAVLKSEELNFVFTESESSLTEGLEKDIFWSA